MNTDAKIVFFGFGDVGYKCLKYMLENDCNVIAVFTHECDTHEKQWFESPETIAKKWGIDVYKPKDINTKKWIRKIKNLKPDLILSLYYRMRIPEEIFTQAQLGAYNLHGSYLPSYRGRAPLNWAILNGENYTGVSLHTLEKDFDTGDVIDRRKIDFSDDEYVGDIQPRVSKTAVDMFADNLPKILSGNVEKIPQCEFEERASYFGKRTPKDSRIDFSKKANDIRNLIRAVSRPFNGAFFDVDNIRYTVWRADIEKSDISIPEATIVECSQKKLIFSAKDALIVSTDFEISNADNE